MSIAFSMFLCLALVVGFAASTTQVTVLNEAKEKHTFSQLSFDTDPFHHEEESTLANESFWGRLYIESFPDRKGFQYFRAHYGVPPPVNETTFVLADPIDLCSDEEYTAGNLKDTVLVVRRGVCSFADKSRAAHEAGARGILFVNNEVSISVCIRVHLPSHAKY